MARRNTVRSEVRIPADIHGPFVERCKEVRVTFNTALVTLMECVVGGSLQLEGPEYVRCAVRDLDGAKIGQFTAEMSNRMKRDKLIASGASHLVPKERAG